MAVFSELWSQAFSAGIIANTASETFGGDITTIADRDKYGSANFLVISSRADEEFLIELDGLSSRAIAILPARGSFIIEPAEGTFFNTVKLTNESGTSSSADEVKIRMGRSQRVGA